MLTGTINGHTVNETRSEYVFAMGSPDIELWKNSWNAKYSEDTIYTKYEEDLVKDNITYNGWYIGDTANPSTASIGVRAKEGYNNTLYYPHKEIVDSNNCNGYWLSSPSADNYSNIIYVFYYGSIAGGVYSNPRFAARPVVSLPTNIVNQ